MTTLAKRGTLSPGSVPRPGGHGTPKRKKVLQIVRSAQYGGVETHVFELIKYGLEEGYEMVLLSLADMPVSDKFGQAGIAVFKLTDTMRMSVKSLATIYSLREILKEIKPDIVHLHGTRPLLVGSIAARLAGVRTIVATLHNSYTLMSCRAEGAVDAKLLVLGKLVYRTGCLLSHRVISVAEQLADEARSLIGGLPFYSTASLDRKLVVIHSGVDPALYYRAEDRVPFRNSYAIGMHTTVIGTVTRLDEPKKGIGVLLKAAGILKKRAYDFKIVIVGEGDSKKALVTLAQKLELQEHVLFTGYCDDVPGMLSNFDLFVLPSLSEGFPLVNLEAMASVLPVVATSVGGVPEAVRHGENGLLVPPSDESSLAGALAALIDDPVRARRMGERGRTIVQEEFAKKRLLKRILDIYQ